MRINTFVLVVLVSGCFLSAGSGHLRHPIDIIVVPPAEFSAQQLEARFRTFLPTSKEKPELYVVQAITDMRLLNAGLKPTSHTTYDMWSKWYTDYKGSIPAQAELLVIGSNAAMRVREPSGNITHIVLTGVDPYSMDANGSVSLLAVSYRKSASLSPKRLGGDKFISWFDFYLVVHGQATEDIARTATEKLHALASSSGVTVSLRSDPWFITDTYFPIASPYLDTNSPPMFDEYKNSTEWYCIANAPGIRCDRYVPPE